MPTSSTTLAIAVVAFASTNVDDILLLAALFSDPTIKRRSIVLGQFLGIAALVATSYVAARLALNIPVGWVALLGAAPLVLGLLKLKALRRGLDPADDADDFSTIREHSAQAPLHSQVLAVSMITVANGGDNLGVYIPLFASSAEDVGIYSVAFMVMTGLWCALGYYAVHNPVFGGAARRYGPRLLPYVLIALGLYILAGALVLFE